MNREILFRGKRADNGKWVYGGYHKWETRQPCPVGNDELKSDEIKHVIIINSFADWGMPRAMQACEIIPETVGQYTGLKDNNGTKIFEGDIVEYNDGYDYFKGEVTFENGAFGIGCDEIIGISNGCSDNFENLWQLFWNQEVTDEPMLYYCSVIGNIHDNPELLER